MSVYFSYRQEMEESEWKWLGGDNYTGVVDHNVAASMEKALFEAFVVPSKRRRYLELLGTERGREKIRFALDHFGDLDLHYCHRIKPSQQRFDNILQALNNLGAPPVCYVMSSDADLDRRQMDLSAALKNIIGLGQGAFVSCVPGKLAYFESEEKNERYICHRENSQS